VAQADGEVIITNDGATILNKMKVEQPAAKMLVDLAKSQDVVAGDGTTSVTVLCGALLKKSLELLERGVHPTVISDAFGRAADKAVEVRGPSPPPPNSPNRRGPVLLYSVTLKPALHVYCRSSPAPVPPTFAPQIIPTSVYL
jgi:T-complex protein 1 subunit delta